jgi:hypothetical protein
MALAKNIHIQQQIKEMGITDITYHTFSDSGLSGVMGSVIAGVVKIMGLI